MMLFLYLTRKSIASYEVVYGTIAGNYRYNALAIKEEEIVKSDISGNIAYYAREGAKAHTGMIVCAVGVLNTASGKENGIVTELSEDSMTQAKDEIMSFAVNFNEDAFSSTYGFKSDMQGVILQSSIDEDAGTYVSGSYAAQKPGFVLYSVDGMEDLTADTLSVSDFNSASYQNMNLRLKSAVNAGDPIFKLVTNDTWDLCFPVDNALRRDLEGVDKVKVRFLKDNSTFSAHIEIVEGKDGTYGKVTLTSSLVRYVTDRYLEIELILNRASGLKIPVTSISEKTFVEIPEEYATVNEDTTSEIYLIRETFAADGSSTTSGVNASVYSFDRETGHYLVNTSLFETGDYIIMPGTNRKYQITDETMRTIQGVYNINKGYAVFREVNILDENEEFCIVNPGNVYGLSAHDRIALDASKVDTDDIVIN